MGTAQWPRNAQNLEKGGNEYAPFGFHATKKVKNVIEDR